MGEHPSVVEMWWQYLRALEQDPDHSNERYSAWYFADNEKDADELAALVMDGRKRATAASVWEIEARGEPMPRAGDLSVVTNWAGEARCIIRTTRVAIVPYEEVSAEFAAIEGEGDGSLEYWRSVHWPYYERVLGAFGRAPERRMPIACEQFEVVFPPPR